MTWEQLTTCPLCGSEELRFESTAHTLPQIKAEVYGTELHMATLINYYTCQDCGLIFQNPRMKNLEQFYSEAYRQIYKEGDEEFARATRLTEYLKEKGVPVTSHLDIGCSRGAFLKATREAFGCEILGLEFNPDKPEVPSVTSKEQVTEKYDLVTSIHCLEHTLAPHAELAWMRDHCKGHVIVEIPKHDTPRTLAHTLYFPPWTIRNLFRMYFELVDYRDTNIRLVMLGKVDR